MNYPHHTIPRPPGSLKNATVGLVRASGGTEAAAEYIREAGVRGGMSQTQMQRYGSVRQEDAECFMPIDVALALESHCGCPLISTFMALQQGYVLIATAAHGDAPLAKDIAVVCKEIAELFQCVSQSLVDGRVTKAEAGPIIEHCMRAISAVCSVIAEMRLVERASK